MAKITSAALGLPIVPCTLPLALLELTTDLQCCVMSKPVVTPTQLKLMADGLTVSKNNVEYTSALEDLAFDYCEFSQPVVEEFAKDVPPLFGASFRLFDNREGLTW
eukprot:CAMPEP_0174268916 /NCGR_PEP_ID=MMETSP0439-20130205/39177_1 /TAXON_ID=0 /ORGANISM="Stereomyxa ramosa, Strain Chinc5" /LENGTH=105 /DNA_ID=CAMNT_0015357397 /DNA_START=21 /DNA_END=335 /DNA_ORIENTATION=-